MSRNEKRTFTLEAKRNNATPQYWQIFSEINKMKEYDEGALKKTFNSSNFSEEKAYLYDALLRSLRNQNAEENLTRQIKNKILDAGYLFHAQMFEESKDLLKQAEKMAIKIGDSILQLEINREMRRALKAERGDAFEKDLTEKIEAVSEIQQAIDKEMLALKINDEILIASNYARNNRPESFINNVKDKYQLFFQNDNKPNNLKSRFRFLQARVLYASMIEDIPSRDATIAEIYKLWKENQFFQKEDSYAFIVDLGNLITIYSARQQFKKAKPILAELEAIQPRNLLEEVHKFRKLKILQLNYNLNMGIIKDYEKFDKEVRVGLVKYSIPKIAQRRAYFNLAILTLMAGDAKKCKRYCDWLIGKDPNKDETNILISASILKILALFKLEDEHTEKYIRKTKAWLKKIELILDFEFKVIDYLMRLEKEGSLYKKSILQEFHTYLLTIETSSEDIHELLLCWTIENLFHVPIWKQFETRNGQ